MSRANGLGLVLGWAVVLAFLVASAATAAAADAYRITVTRADVSAYPTIGLVASVTDASGRAVKGLRAADVFVSEDGRAVTPDVRLASEVAPVSIVFAIDTSGSMSGSIADTKSAARSFVDTLTPTDRAAVITFSTSASVVQDLTGDRAALHAAIDGIGAVGNTALYDALDRALAVTATAPATSRRAIVLLTDGIDNSSGTSLADVRERVRAAGVPLFLIGLGARVDDGILTTLATASQGGRLLVTPSSAQLAALYDTLAEQLRSDLSISYRSESRRASASVVIEWRRDNSVLARTELTVALPVAASAAASTTTPAPAATAAPAVDLPVSAPEPAIGIALLGAATSGSLVLWVYVRAREREDADRRRRLAEYVRPTADALPERPSRVRGRALASARRVVRPLRPFLPSTLVERTAEWLVKAGEPLGLDAYEFISLRILFGALLGVIATVLMLLVRPEPILILGAAVMGALLGYTIPGILLGMRVRSRKRAMMHALPGALDMLALSTAAGLTLDGAIAQVVTRWDTPLSDELRRYLAEVRVGGGRKDALHGLAKRIDLVEMTHLTTTILQADVLGVPIANVLREQAVELRRERRQKAEEAARLAPVKMLFPMALLIFPALFVVILGPVVPVVLQAFGS